MMDTQDGGERLAVLEKEVAELREDIKSLLEAWQAATGLVKFVKLLSTLVAALGVIYFFITHGFTKPVG
jgi:hypothetical protein